jgi:ribosomal protein S19
LPYTSRRFNRLSVSHDEFCVLLNENSLFLRRFLIPRSLEGKFISIHNGIDLVDLMIYRREVGHKFGEFSVTKILGAEFRISFGFRKKKKKIRRTKK